jgi:MFS family permease
MAACRQRHMLIDIGPLRHNTAFRRLFASQFISGLGTMVSYVAVPWQVYELTRSNAQVGLLGLVQLVPVVVCGLVGGAVADRVDRKRLLMGSEALMALCVAGLLANALTATPSAFVIYALVAVLQGASGFHRPALEALTQKLARPEEFAAVAALSSVRGTVGMVAGPALAGLLLARWGAVGAYLFDVVSFVVALFFIARIPRERMGRAGGLENRAGERPHLLADLAEGLRFAWARPALMGTYIVDIVAMAFAFPIALFPAMAAAAGRTESVGWLLSAMAVGALLIGLFSGWAGKVTRHGRAVVMAAAVWALGIVALGFAPSLLLMLVCLVVAGAADMVSGVFRGTIWNETIPNALRGRLAGIEMISYLTGPLIGNVRAGFMADAWGVSASIWVGGLVCLAGVIATGFALPSFWAYRSTVGNRPQR